MSQWESAFYLVSPSFDPYICVHRATNASAIFSDTRPIDAAERAACKGLIKPNCRSRLNLVNDVSLSALGGDINDASWEWFCGEGLEHGAKAHTLLNFVNIGVSRDATACIEPPTKLRRQFNILLLRGSLTKTKIAPQLVRWE